MSRFVYALAATVLSVVALFGAEPKLIPVGGYVDHKIDVPKGAAVIWRITPAPVQRSTDLEPGRVIFSGEKGTKYTATAITVDFDKKTVTDADYEFLFAGSPSIPNPKPKDPPTTPTAGLYFMVIRADGPATPYFTKTMGLPEWKQLRDAGHLVKDFTLADSKQFVTLPGDVSLPVVAVLQEGETTSKLLRVVPLPSTGAGILDLPK